MRKVLAALAISALACATHAENAATPLADPVLEPPTLHCLGTYWIISGDDNANARIEVFWRVKDSAEWRAGAPLFRVEKGAHKTAEHGTKLDVPESAWLFAGSVLFLTPATEYELKLALSDPDGGTAEKLLTARTRGEPELSENARKFHVAPGSGGGSGTAADPFKGIAAAQKNAKPGDIFLLHAGTYEGMVEINRNGEPGKPIAWCAAGDGEVVLNGPGKTGKGSRVIAANDTHDLWFEGLTIRNADYGIVVQDCSGIVIKRCTISGVDFGIACTRNGKDNVRGFFISDNTISGPSTWPRTKGIESARGIQITGAGHVICYNRISAFADAIDTFPSARCAAIDIHNNDISECTDDGIEMDYSERNTRCFYNRLTNVYQGLSVQPVYGGPVYVLRNALYNVTAEPFKMHNSPSGALMMHNTVVKEGPPLILMTDAKVRNCVLRNNLYVGTKAPYAFECQPMMLGCDFDYDAFAGGPFSIFLKWNKQRYQTAESVKTKAPVYRNLLVVEPDSLFESNAAPPADPNAQAPLKANDLRLKKDAPVIDTGAILPGINDGFTGKAPDRGAYEAGAALPHYGPRPAK
ncbi:MAG TPA: right-handed parallel beta-helix repeat-containing protein [Planctomycetota bacterium]|nr:right-handed parallel beta-helix repeat-containing protein [Planctomycetota bacterium]